MSYLGRIRRPDAAGPRGADGTADWSYAGGDTQLALRAAGASTRLFTWDGLALLVRGYARPAGTVAPLDLERLAEEVRGRYLEHGDLAVDGLDGSFTLALLDGQAGRVLLYRNLIGSGLTYYHAGPDGLLFAGNLAELVEAVGRAETNRDALAPFFLFRCVPGRETLFADVYRLLPGEQVCWSPGNSR